jgi:hypothetical protein
METVTDVSRNVNKIDACIQNNTFLKINLRYMFIDIQKYKAIHLLLLNELPSTTLLYNLT